MKRALRPVAVALVGALVAPFVIHGAAAALATLATARQETAALAAEVAAPAPSLQPLLPRGTTIIAPDSDAAGRALADRLRLAAARSGILLEQLAAADERAPILSRRITASGSEAAILAFVRAIEGGAPLVRFSEWHLAPGAGDGAPLRLEARAVALWARP